MKNRGENYQSSCFVYKGQCFWYFQNKRHCFTQTNPEINGNFKGKECICSMKLAGIFTIHFTYSIFLSATTELVHTGPLGALEDVHASDTEGMWWCCPQSHSNQLQSNLRSRLLLLYLKDKFNKRPKMAKSSSLTPYKAPSLTTQSSWMPQFVCQFGTPPHFDVSIQMSVWKLCAVQTETKKKQGRKISLANFQLLYDSNSFLSPAAQCYRPDLCPGSREHLDHIPHVCLLIALCSDFPAYLEASYSTFNTFKLNLA